MQNIPCLAICFWSLIPTWILPSLLLFKLMDYGTEISNPQGCFWTPCNDYILKNFMSFWRYWKVGVISFCWRNPSSSIKTQINLLIRAQNKTVTGNSISNVLYVENSFVNCLEKHFSIFFNSKCFKIYTTAV